MPQYTTVEEQTIVNNPGPLVDFSNVAIVANKDKSKYSKYPFYIQGSSSFSQIRGGAVIGVQPKPTSWRDMKRYYDGTGIFIRRHTGDRVLSGWHFENLMDGIRTEGGPLTIRNCTARDIIDDWYQNDLLAKDTLIDSVYIDGTFVFVSARPGAATSTVNMLPTTTTITNSMVRIDRVWEPTEPDGWLYGGFFKTGSVGPDDQKQASIKPVIRNTIFCARWNGGQYLSGLPLYSDCQNVTFIWEGDEPFQGKLPNGVEFIESKTLWPMLRQVLRQDRRRLTNLGTP